MAAIAKAEMDRALEAANISQIEKKFVTVPAFTEGNTKMLLDKCKASQDSLLEIHKRIMHQSPANIADHEAEYFKLTERLDTLTSDLLTAQLGLVTTSRPPSTPTHHIRLPEIQLPVFEGKYEDWPSFDDLFKATVVNNKTLTDAQRLQYLKSCLRKEPADLIKAFAITDANYKEAWDLLKARYENKREITLSIAKKLLSQSSCKTESVSSLQSLLNTTSECIRSLKVMGQPTDKWDLLLVASLIEKFDPSTKSEWAKSLKGTGVVTFKELTDFLESHIRSLIARGGATTTVSISSNNKYQSQGKARTFHISAAPANCTMCKGSHQLYQCPKLLEMDSAQRMSAVKRTTACLNCLRDGHSVSRCQSRNVCRQCSRKHHSLLHSGDQQRQSTPSQESTTSNKITVTTNVTSSSSSQAQSKQRMFKTAVVDIRDASGVKRPCRVLYDDGSEAEYITEKCASALGLPRQRADVIVEGVAGVTAAHAKSKIATKLYSRVYSDSISVENIYVIPRISGYVPRLPCNKESLSYLDGLPLADPEYDQPGDIDILLGTGIVSYLIKNGIVRGGKQQPVATNSAFGWVLSGVIHAEETQIVRTHHTMCKLEEMVHRFWQIEEPPTTKQFTLEEQQAEDHFMKTHTRKSDGRYVVRLPFNHKQASIGDTKDQAVRRLHQLEKRFKKYPQQHLEYKKFMKEYLDMGHMELVTNQEERTKVVYIPHHFVTKEDSSTTKLRVVFDASMKSSSGISLNDALLVGPTIQDDLYTQLIRFRSHNIAMKADVAKMYRQFEIHQADRDYQTILWRETEDQPILEYRLKTVTYGTAAAPFLATRCLVQLATDEEEKFPQAAKLVKNQMYIDDFLGGASSSQEGVSVFNELTQLCQAGQLDIRKWCSSDSTVLAAIPSEQKEENQIHNFDDQISIKALGIKWNPQDDYFHFNVESKCQQQKTTKREVLSEIARTFDPIGWLTPTTVIAKLLFQDLWKETADWDETCSEEIQQRWIDYQNQLKNVCKIRIPRRVLPSAPADIMICGFADSSETAMACCIYLRATDEHGVIHCNLLTSKSKIAPLKQTSLPRLELCAAVLLAETMESVMKCFTFPFTVHTLTDSMITLCWLTSTTRRWKTYVANRVAQIQSVIPSKCWSHVRSSDNPADLPTRGVAANELVNNSLWFHGPCWLSTNEFPSSSIVQQDEAATEEKTIKMTTLATTALENHSAKLLQFSSLEKIITNVGWFLRFMDYLRMKKVVTISGSITPGDRSRAFSCIIRYVQQQSFDQDIHRLKKGKHLSTNSKLKQLCPFINSTGILCVGGRLQNSHIPETHKHPIILPHDHEFTVTLIRDYHLKLLHGGFSLTLSSLQRKFWILRGRETTRLIIHRCTTCKKVKAQQAKQLMGNLPSARVTPHRPFLHCGVDFAGSFPVKMRKGRGSPSDKCYMAVFVCFSTKAVHLEAVTSLSTPDFIACFKRFTSRRGIPSHLYSDCGTNFVGADKEMKKIMKQAEADWKQKLAKHGTTWAFNPPAAPHQGGLWEAAVKSAKHHLKRIVGPRILTLEQFQSLLCNVEACLNSRPLCAISSDPLDIDALTPGHFLIGEPLVAVPDNDLTMTNEGRLDQWQRVQQMTQHFWLRWRNEYLITLQQRQKWNREEKNIIVGDLVVVKEENQPPTKWRIGRVIDTHPGHDNLVRKVTVKTANGEVEN